MNVNWNTCASVFASVLCHVYTCLYSLAPHVQRAAACWVSRLSYVGQFKCIMTCIYLPLFSWALLHHMYKGLQRVECADCHVGEFKCIMPCIYLPLFSCTTCTKGYSLLIEQTVICWTVPNHWCHFGPINKQGYFIKPLDASDFLHWHGNLKSRDEPYLSYIKHGKSTQHAGTTSHTCSVIGNLIYFISRTGAYMYIN